LTKLKLKLTKQKSKAKVTHGGVGPPREPLTYTTKKIRGIHTRTHTCTYNYYIKTYDTCYSLQKINSKKINDLHKKT